MMGYLSIYIKYNVYHLLYNILHNENTLVVLKELKKNGKEREKYNIVDVKI